MSKNVVVMLLFLSVLFGLGAVFFAKQWMEGQTEPEVKVEEVFREPVVVAAKEIPEGTIIDEQHLTSKLLEKEWREETQHTRVEDVIGTVASVDIYPGEVIHKLRVAPQGEGNTLASLIGEDMRALTIRVNDVIGVAGFLLPGNKVDILNTISYGKSSAATKTVLKDIKVLAVDQTAKTDDNKPIIVRAVTLEVTPKQAELLLTAKSKGAIQLALRNPVTIDKPVKPIRRVAAPSVTILKGTQSSNVRVKD
ncbi:Flp pilus assembly protein CpaB [Vibrio maerlii]|uniref:Flp pilus assembly protein CpaB n=1 Tax=Vibrio maerlii TaxID=2231648 RepID=UPI000E3D4138|nr:Flp pilus assembly protein CpaB [Vibrio maerlii]